MKREEVPRTAFGIVTYCSMSYLDAYEFAIDSWLGNAQADEVIVYTDYPDAERLAKPRPGVRFVHAFSPPVETLPEYPWNRKAEAIQAYYEQTRHPFFVYLDCDCWVRAPFPEVLRDMQFHDVAGTRLLGREDSISLLLRLDRYLLRLATRAQRAFNSRRRPHNRFPRLPPLRKP